MQEAYFCHLSCVLSIHYQCTIDFLLLMQIKLCHSSQPVIPSFSILWRLKVYALLDEVFSCIHILHDQSYCNKHIQFHFEEEKSCYKYSSLFQSHLCAFFLISSWWFCMQQIEQPYDQNYDIRNIVHEKRNLCDHETFYLCLPADWYLCYCSSLY